VYEPVKTSPFCGPLEIMTEKLTWSAFAEGVNATKIKANTTRKQYFRIGYTPSSYFGKQLSYQTAIAEKEALM